MPLFGKLAEPSLIDRPVPAQEYEVSPITPICKNVNNSPISDTVHIFSLSTTNHSCSSDTHVSYLFPVKEGDTRPHLYIDVFGCVMLGLLDSGASLTVIGREGWEKLSKFNLTVEETPIKNCVVANNETCSVIGSVKLPLKLDHRVKVIDVLVVPTLPYTMILGVNFFVSMGLVPNLARGTYEFDFLTPESLQTDDVKAIYAVVPREHLTSEQQQKLNDLTNKYLPLLSRGLGKTNLVEHRIEVTSQPIRQRAYRVSPVVQERIDAEISKMLELGVIERSRSAWSSPVLLVAKTDGTWRFCVDYRSLNKVTKKNAYPIPYINNILDKLRNARYLSSIDLNSAFWQVPVEEKSREYTAFAIPGRGHFQFTRLPFGLTNSPATFQQLMDIVIDPVLEPFCFSYLDDIICVTETFEKHLSILESVFKRLLEAGLTVSPEKCKFCRPELKYLGYVVNEKGLSPDEDKVKAIVDIPTPRGISDVRRLLGTASYYRRFIPNFSTRVAPITQLLHKNHTWVWTGECESAFKYIKNCLATAATLSCPDFSRPFVVETDASAFGIGAVLLQEYEEGNKIICYISRSLSRAERKYSATERELLAIIWAVEHLRPYLEGYKFTVVTDHHSLIWLHNLKEPSGRLARWALRLQRFDFEIRHRKGKDNVVPDLLSRSVPVIDSVEIGCIDVSNIRDKWYLRQKENVMQRPLDYPSWRVAQDKLFKYIPGKYSELKSDSECWKEVVPKDYRRKILQESHDSTSGCHSGILKTFERVRQKYYWPRMRADITSYVTRCSVCLKHKSSQQAPAGEMGRRPNINRPFQMLSIDIAGPLPRSSHGYKFILAVSDYLSKYVLLFPMRSATASTVTKLIEDNVFLEYGVPEFLIADNGVQFRSREFTKMCEGYKTKIIFNTLYHAQANPVERVNRVVKTMLSSYVSEHQKDWDKLLPKVACAIRTNVSEVTGVTPFFVVFGREHKSTGDSYRSPIGSDLIDFTSSSRQQVLSSVFKDVKEKLEQAHRKTKARYDLRRRPIQFLVGQKVFRKNHVLSNAANAFTAKLAPKYVGPFVIKKKLSPLAYELADHQGKSGGVWHIQDLKAHPPDDDMDSSDLTQVH